MSYFYDMIDWVGGYPFEVSKPEQVTKFLKVNNFIIKKIKKNTGYGNNIFLAKKIRKVTLKLKKSRFKWKINILTE